MGIRRSLRLQSRSGGINENAKQSVKKNKLPRKRKVQTNFHLPNLYSYANIIKTTTPTKISVINYYMVKVKSSTKIYSGLTPRRSLRIKKRNSYYSVEGDLSAVDQSTTQIINNVKIEPCEVKLEQIDMLIEKLSIGSNEINDCKESQKPVNCEEVRDTMEVPMESEQYENNCTDEQSNENCKSSVETDITCPNEEANPTEIDIKEIEDETLKEQKERFGEREETAKKITEMLNQYKVENEIDFDEINSISSTFEEETVIDTSWDKEVVPNCYREKIINNVLFNNTNAYTFKSCFKDRASLTKAFDRHSGQVSNETYPYDIHETPEAEKVKRFYRKNISDPSLHSWYQYNVVTSKRFSKQDSEELIPSKPYIERFLLF